MYNFISMYAFLHTGTDLEAALEQIDVVTVDPFDGAKSSKVAEIFLEKFSWEIEIVIVAVMLKYKNWKK